MKRIRVTVTQEDIDKGEVADGSSCPIARAVRRVGFPLAFVDARYWWPEGEGLGRPAIRLPESAHRFVVRFDDLNDRKPVKPATFLLPVPE